MVYCTSQLVELFTAKPVCTWPDCCSMEMTVLRQKFLFAVCCSTLVPVSVDPLMNGQTDRGTFRFYVYIYTHTQGGPRKSSPPSVLHMSLLLY